jgi:hypothetical protein
MNVVDKINSIVYTWKSGYMEEACNAAPQRDFRFDVSGKSYAEIMGGIASRLADDGISSKDRWGFSMEIIRILSEKYGGFYELDVAAAHARIFGSAMSLADYMGMEDIDLSYGERYIVVPAGTKRVGRYINGGYPIGIRGVPYIPEILEIFFVTPDRNVHAIEDVLYMHAERRGFTLKGVSELPADIVAYAKASKLRLK